MLNLFTSTAVVLAILAITALAGAEETIVEKRTYESERNTAEVVPAPAARERVVEERSVTQGAPTVRKHTDTVVTTDDEDADRDDDHDDDNDND